MAQLTMCQALPFSAASITSTTRPARLNASPMPCVTVLANSSAKLSDCIGGLLQRLRVGLIYRRFRVQQTDELLPGPGHADLPFPHNFLCGELAPVELLVCVAVGAHRGAFERQAGE